MRKRIAIVTGATGGVGEEFVRQMLGRDIEEIWAIARNEERLSALEKRFGERIVPLAMDLSDADSLSRLEQMLSERKPVVAYLVNNAGLARMGKYDTFTPEEISRTVDVNCKAPLFLINLCIPYMERGSRILNISSAAAFQPNPYLSLYAATKVFERSYSRALHMELKGTGITATAVCPGWIDTELLVHEMNGRQVRFPGMVTAERVVTRALRDAERGRDMSVCSLYVKCQHLNVKLLPQRWVMKLWMRGIRRYL